MNYWNLRFRAICLPLLSCCLFCAMPTATVVASEPVDEAWVETLESMTSFDWMSPFELERLSESQDVDSDHEMTREALILSLSAFQQALIEGNNAVYKKEIALTVHSEASADYLLYLVESLKEESAQAIAIACNTQIKEGAVRDRIKQSDGETTSQRKSAHDANASTDTVVLQRLSSYGIDMRLADGSHRFEQPLTQSQYINALRQLDEIWATEFDVDSVITGYPNYPAFTPTIREEMDADLGELLTRVDTVRSLIGERCDQEVSISKDAVSVKTYDTAIAKAAQIHLAQGAKERTERKTKDIQEIIDISPEDALYAPLSILIEEWGFEILLQPNGALEPEGIITRGEAAHYISELAEVYWSILWETPPHATVSRLYNEMIEDLAEIEQNLRVALDPSQGSVN